MTHSPLARGAQGPRAVLRLYPGGHRPWRRSSMFASVTRYREHNMGMHRRFLALAIALAAAQAMASGASPPTDGAPTRRLPAKVTFHKAPSDESPAER